MAGDGDFRFPSTMRLKKKTEFVRVFRKGIAWKGSYFSLHVLPRSEDSLPSEGGPRLGMVVTRKVGSAVERNRIKRKIREAFRKMAHSMPAVDIVIRPNATCREIPETLITRSLGKAVKVALESVKERT
jgi:ribonuclease P protein component